MQTELAIEFRYPSPQNIDRSLVHVLRLSQPVTMADGNNIIRPPSRLSESWDDIRSEKSREDDLQSENSTAFSLIRKNQEEDVESIDESHATISEVDGDSDGNIAASQELAVDEDGQREGGHDSSLTARPSYSQDISLQQQPWSGPEDITLKHTIHVFDHSESVAITNSLGKPFETVQLFGTLSMNVSNKDLDLDRPFRLVYVGDSSQRTPVLAKIGDALIAGKRPGFVQNTLSESRYHVIPTSYDQDAPTELVPIEAQLVVDECTTAASTRAEHPLHEKIYLRFKKGRQTLFTSSWTGKCYELSPSAAWSAPDIAVLCLSNNDDAVMRERLRIAALFMKRHGVPTILLTEDPAWGSATKFSEIHRGGLRFCVESSDQIIQEIPVDLGTFENINSTQLSHHITYLLESSNSQPLASLDSGQKAIQPLLPLPKYGKDVEKNLTKSFYQREIRGSLLEIRALQVSAALILTLLTSILAYGFFFFFIARTPLSVDRTPYISPTIPAKVFATTTDPVTSVQTGVSVHTLEPSSAVAPQKVETSLSKLVDDLNAVRSAAVKPPDSAKQVGKFDVRIIGRSHLILQPPKALLDKKGSLPKVSVTVQRGRRNITAHLERVFDNVHTVRLDAADAIGKLVVTITIENLYHQEKHEVCFGNPWLKIQEWQRSATQLKRTLDRDVKLLGMGASQLFEDYKHFRESLYKSFMDPQYLSMNATYPWKNTAGQVWTQSKQLFETSAEQSKTVSRRVSAKVDSTLQTLTGQSHKSVTNTRQIARGVSQYASSILARLNSSEISTRLIPKMPVRSLHVAQKRALRFLDTLAGEKRRSSHCTHANRRRANEDGKACDR